MAELQMYKNINHRDHTALLLTGSYPKQIMFSQTATSCLEDVDNCIENERNQSLEG